MRETIQALEQEKTTLQQRVEDAERHVSPDREPTSRCNVETVISKHAMYDRSIIIRICDACTCIPMIIRGFTVSVDASIAESHELCR